MRYGLTKRFSRGITIGMLPTYKCNLDCSYCANKYGRQGNKFDSKEILISDWYRLISNFPIKIRELHITGGEPMLYAGIQFLVEKLLTLGFHISLNSNLLCKRDFSNVISDRFRIEATLHDHDREDRFFENVEYYRQWVRVDIDIFAKEKVYRNSKTGIAYKKLMDPESPICLDMKRFKFTPDGRLWTNDREIGDAYSINFK